MNLQKLNILKSTLSDKLLMEENLENLIINKDWLIGFAEAEGSFYGNVNQAVFKLTQHSADAGLLLAIKNYLGHGNINSFKTKEGVSIHVLVITKKSIILEKIIPIFNGNLFTEKKREQFKDWIVRFFPEVTIIDNDQACPSPSWVAGFVDGDGSFYSLIGKSNSYNCGFTVKIVFEIAQIFSETPLLDAIGNQHFGGRHRWAVKSGPVQHLRISGLKANNECVVPFFDLNNLLSRKRIDFLIWREMLDLINQKKHLQVEGVETIRQLRELQHYYRTSVNPLAEYGLNSSLKFKSEF